MKEEMSDTPPRSTRNARGTERSHRPIASCNTFKHAGRLSTGCASSETRESAQLPARDPGEHTGAGRWDRSVDLSLTAAGEPCTCPLRFSDDLLPVQTGGRRGGGEGCALWVPESTRRPQPPAGNHHSAGGRHLQGLVLSPGCRPGHRSARRAGDSATGLRLHLDAGRHLQRFDRGP